jgi:hypothetical protein
MSVVLSCSIMAVHEEVVEAYGKLNAPPEKLCMSDISSASVMGIMFECSLVECGIEGSTAVEW